jgi:hypothetical protein
MDRIKILYSTTDGESFNSRSEAEQHQKKVDTWEAVLEKFGIYGELRINYLSDFLEIQDFIEQRDK